jgi:PAS domain S-box-containing protein
MFSYRTKFLIIYFIVISLVGLLIYNLFVTISQTNVDNISNKNLNNKAVERIDYMQDFFNPYYTTLKAISQNKTFKEYLTNGSNKELIEEYFLSVKKSLPCGLQVRYLDINGQEIIKIDGIPMISKIQKPSSNIIPKHKLQNKSYREYVQKFLNLKKDEVGTSYFSLNKEFGKVQIPKRPVVRIGMKVYDNNGVYKGIAIINVCLRYFFTSLNKTTLYHIHLMDSQGRFLSHHDKRYGLTGENTQYTLFDEFPELSKDVLKKDVFQTKNIFIKKLDFFDNGQNIRIVLENKFIQESLDTHLTKKQFLFAYITFAIVLLPLALYFAKRPDDLEEELQLQKTIEEKNILIETLLKNIPIPMFYKDINGIYHNINDKFTEVFGIEYDEIVGKTCYEIAPQKLADIYKQQDEDLLNSDGSTQIYESHIHNLKTNQRFIVEFHKNILFDSNGNKIGIVGSVVDITEYTNMKNELLNINTYLNEKVKEQTEDIKEKMDVISQNVLYSRTDKFGKIVDVSDAFCKLSGYSKEELIGSSHNIIRHPDSPKELFIDMWGKLKSFQSWKGEIQNRKKDGSSYWVFSDIQPKYNDKGEHIGYISVRSDITDRKLFEQQQLQMLEQSKMAAMGEMIGNIAHQWRQPLSVITTVASGVAFKQEYKTLKEEDIPKDMDNIVQSAEYLSETIETFRNFLKEKKERKNICIQNRLHEVLNILKATIKNNDINIIDNISNSELVTINMVSGELEQVIINIINNSKDVFLEKNIEERWIKLELEKYEDKVVFSIEDNGGGIPEHIMPKIFEAYFTTKHQSKGTGLGLNMSYRIVTESLGGKLYVKNTNNGAKFFIEIPMNS